MDKQKLVSCLSLCIEDEAIVKKILKHLGIWEVKREPRPRGVSHVIPEGFLNIHSQLDCCWVMITVSALGYEINIDFLHL